MARKKIREYDSKRLLKEHLKRLVGIQIGHFFCSEFLTRLLGGVIRETQLMIGEDGGIARLGELRGGEERRIPLELGENGFVRVGYSYIEGGVEEYIRTGEIVVSTCEKREVSDGGEAGGRRDMSTISAARTSIAENWNYHDPYMTRRWAKHLHGQRL